MSGIAGSIVCAVIANGVYDGDTIKVTCEVWPTFEVSASVRVDGIDTPELRGKCEAEKALAIKARDTAREIVGEFVELRNVRLGKFAGRVIADVYADGVKLADILIERGQARPYFGGKREGWC